MTAQPHPTTRATAGELALAVVTIARLLDSHDIRPWSFWAAQDAGMHDGPRFEFSIERDDLARIVADVDDAKVTTVGYFTHLNGRVDGVAVEFYADATESDKAEASNRRQSDFYATHPRVEATS